MLQFLIRRVVAPASRALYRPVVTGAENVPAEGPVILASNHLAAVDTAVIPFVLPRPVAFLGKAEYFSGTSLRGRFVARFLSALGFVPVERGNAHAGLDALTTAGDVLQRGGMFGIYPEGTRSLDGRVHRGHTGVAQLALAHHAVVVPVALSGTDELLPKGKKLPQRAEVTVTFGAPLDFSRYDGLVDSPAIRRAVTDEIMYAICELSGREYVDSYHKRPDQ